ncbi:hypothetical protein [Streptomyces sp. NPDC093225]|uniref:hypothetical protein n=1 Tax=Streptomyces sp. NPDC093225 TaxID=3366034 RepID=UPI003819B49C
MFRRDLPHPPPPAHIRPRPAARTAGGAGGTCGARGHDGPGGPAAAVVAREERARVLAELVRCSLGYGRLLLMWCVSAVAALGWSFLGMAGMSFGRGGAENILGLFFAALGAGVLVPAGFGLAAAVRLDREARRLLCAWAASGRDPAGDPRHRAPGRSLVWLLSSLAVCALGLWVSFGVAVRPRSGGTAYGEVVYFMGLAVILWITGLAGVAKAAVHYRWAVRAFTGLGPGCAGAGRPAGTADRPAAYPVLTAPPLTRVPEQGDRSASKEHPPPASG